MAKVNLMELQPTRLCKDLRGRFVEIFGREKAGKTSTAVLWPKPLLCAFEVGYHALAGVYAADIDNWSTFKDICRQLKKPEMKERFETIIIDTVGIAYSMCEDYIKQQQGVTEISEIAWGRGFKMLREEFEKTFRDLSKQGYAIVFIAHSKTKVTDVTDSEGNKLEQISPNLPAACAEAVNGLVDIIAYLGVEYDENREQAQQKSPCERCHGLGSGRSDSAGDYPVVVLNTIYCVIERESQASVAVESEVEDVHEVSYDLAEG